MDCLCYSVVAAAAAAAAAAAPAAAERVDYPFPLR